MGAEADQSASAAKAASQTDGGADDAGFTIRRAAGDDRATVEALFDASLAGESTRAARSVLERARAQTLSLLDASARTVLQRRGADDTDDADDADDARETDNDADAWLWVAATAQGKVIGAAALRRLGEHEVELSRIEVHPEHRRMGVATGLLERILGFCHDHGHLKVVLYTDATEAPAISLFRKFKFHFHRARSEGRRDRLEYYLDLYQRPTSPDESEG